MIFLCQSFRLKSSFNDNKQRYNDFKLILMQYCVKKIWKYKLGTERKDVNV